MYAHGEAKFRTGRLAAAALSGADAIGTAATLLTLDHNAMAVQINSTLDVEVVVVVNGNVAWRLDADEDLYFSAAAIGRMVEPGIIKVYYYSSAPSAGSIRITAYV